MKTNAKIERSYFRERWQEIVLNGKGLELKTTTGGVPRDLDLGPKLNMYMTFPSKGIGMCTAALQAVKSEGWVLTISLDHLWKETPSKVHGEAGWVVFQKILSPFFWLHSERTRLARSRHPLIRSLKLSENESPLWKRRTGGFAANSAGSDSRKWGKRRACTPLNTSLQVEMCLGETNYDLQMHEGRKFWQKQGKQQCHPTKSCEDPTWDAL